MKVNHEVLKAYLNAQDKELTRLQSYIDGLENLRRTQKIPATYISFEIIQSLVGALEAGFKNNEILDRMPKSIGNETISVPAKLMYVLAALWEDYKTAPKPNLGKSFGLNPNEQGKRSVLSIIETHKNEAYLAERVFLAYLIARSQRTRETLLQIYEEIAEEEKVSSSAVKNAYRKHGPNLRKKFRELGIIF
jgi:hypothetical protein